MMKKILILTCLTLTLACEKKNSRDDLQPPDFKDLHKETLIKKTDTFQLSGKEQNRDDAIINFLRKSARSDASAKDSILSEEEYKNYFLPHTIGTGTSLDTTPLDTYWGIFTERRKLGLERILSKLNSVKDIHAKVEFDTRRREYGPWIAWKVNSIVLVDKKGKVEFPIEEIKLVACYKEKCKIAVVAP
jgi:hypothetical protein